MFLKPASETGELFGSERDREATAMATLRLREVLQTFVARMEQDAPDLFASYQQRAEQHAAGRAWMGWDDKYFRPEVVGAIDCRNGLYRVIESMLFSTHIEFLRRQNRSAWPLTLWNLSQADFADLLSRALSAYGFFQAVDTGLARNLQGDALQGCVREEFLLFGRRTKMLARVTSLIDMIETLEKLQEAHPGCDISLYMVSDSEIAQEE